MEVQEINSKILELHDEVRNQVSDWYHTFWELYDHRCVLYIALVNISQWLDWGISFIKSKTLYHWSSRDWRFVVQWYIEWMQISYHLPIRYWDNVLCKEVEKADERDWHTSQDVLDRLLRIK